MALSVAIGAAVMIGLGDGEVISMTRLLSKSC